MSKSATFNKSTDAMGFGLFVAMLEKNGINYKIVECADRWIVFITGHKI